MAIGVVLQGACRVAATALKFISKAAVTGVKFAYKGANTVYKGAKVAAKAAVKGAKNLYSAYKNTKSGHALGSSGQYKTITKHTDAGSEEFRVNNLNQVNIISLDTVKCTNGQSEDQRIRHSCDAINNVAGGTGSEKALIAEDSCTIEPTNVGKTTVKKIVLD